MTLLGTGFRRVLLLIIIAVFLLLAALNIFFNYKLSSEVPILLERISNESPYKIHVRKAGLDPLFRVSFDGVSVTDPSAEEKEVLIIERVVVKPEIISSILSRKINLGEVVLKKAVAQSGRDNINKLLDFINKQSGESKRESKVGFGSFKILSAEFQISPEFHVSVPELNIHFSDDETGKGQRIAFRGKINLLEKEIKSEGSILISRAGTAGDIEINLDGIDSRLLSSFADGAKKLNAVAKIHLEINDVIDINGNTTLNSESGIFSEKPIADADYSLTYDKANDAASINKFYIRVNDHLSGSFSGEIAKLIEKTDFNITGSLSPLDLNGLMVTIFGEDKGILSGELDTKNIRIIGSRTENNIKLTGKTVLNGFNYKPDDEGDPRIKDLTCGLNMSQEITSAHGFKLNSNGNCSAEQFFWDKTGEINRIKSRVNVESTNKWRDNRITLSEVTSRFMEGSAGGTLSFFLSEGFGGGITKLRGNIIGTNLSLSETPKTIIPANIAGTASTASANFEGGSGNYEADIMIAVDNFILKSDKGRDLRISQVQTINPVTLKYESGEVEQGFTNQAVTDEITLRGKDISYRNLSFEEYAISEGKVKSLDFFLELGKDRWSLDMSSQGSDFAIHGYDVTLHKFSENLQIENSSREGFSGSIIGTGGKYRSTDFPELSWSYNFINDRIIVSDVKAQISTLGQFRTDKLFINIGDLPGGYPYRINFDEAAFSGFENKLESSGIEGEFIINKPGAAEHDWLGNVQIKKTTLVSAVIDNISNAVTPAQSGVNLENIKGKFLNGEISGNISINTTTTPSGVVANLKLLNASVNSGSTSVKIGESILGFKGKLPDGSLPEGSSTLELKNILLQNEGSVSRLNASLTTRTVAETLYIDQGFIQDSVTKKISFTGQMYNSFNENRTLNITFPEVMISDAFGLLLPFVPQDLRGFKTRGYISLDLIFHNFLYPGGRWGGKLSLTNSSLSGNYGGALLSVRDINGTITIKDKVSSDNPLAEVMGDRLKLSKSIFQKFLKSFNETSLEKEDLDFLKIKEIEYGILKFEDVECALEVDSKQVNLRRIISRLFRGDLDGVGLIQFNQEKTSYDLSLLFNEISLESVSEKVSPNQEYITGRINGLLWLTGEGGQLDTIDGPFQFWSKKSGKEQRKIGKALLAQLGAKERLILGSNRSYDKGNISGYINKGFITFTEFNISNSILGITNLSIQADTVKNSISISHLISVVRELSRRSGTGGPTIETN